MTSAPPRPLIESSPDVPISTSGPAVPRIIVSAWTASTFASVRPIVAMDTVRKVVLRSVLLCCDMVVLPSTNLSRRPKVSRAHSTEPSDDLMNAHHIPMLLYGSRMDLCVLQSTPIACGVNCASDIRSGAAQTCDWYFGFSIVKRSAQTEAMRAPYRGMQIGYGVAWIATTLALLVTEIWGPVRQATLYRRRADLGRSESLADGRVSPEAHVATPS